jgi:hypothetical protein
VQVRVCIHPSPALTVERRLRLWFGAPTLAFALALPTLARALLPHLHPPFPLAPAVWYGTRWLRAVPVRARTRAFAEMEKRGCPREQILPSLSQSLLVRTCLPWAHTDMHGSSRRRGGCDLGLYAALARVIELSRRGVCAYSRRSRCLLPARIRRALRGYG